MSALQRELKGSLLRKDHDGDPPQQSTLVLTPSPDLPHSPGPSFLEQKSSLPRPRLRLRRRSAKKIY